jgi:hypothetical protein
MMMGSTVAEELVTVAANNLEPTVDLTGIVRADLNTALETMGAVREADLATSYIDTRRRQGALGGAGCGCGRLVVEVHWNSFELPGMPTPVLTTRKRARSLRTGLGCFSGRSVGIALVHDLGALDKRREVSE